MTKKFFVFLAGFILLSCIPGIAFFLFREPDASQYYNHPKTGLTGVIKAHSPDINAILTPQHTPLKTGKQLLKLDIEESDTHKPYSKPVSVTVWMAMGQHAMTTETQVISMQVAGHYQVSTDFTMAGAWQVDVLPKGKQEKISLKFNVED